MKRNSEVYKYYSQTHIDGIIEDCLNSACQTYQDALGITDGGTAGAFFSDDENKATFELMFKCLIEQELQKLLDNGLNEELNARRERFMATKTWSDNLDEDTSGGADCCEEDALGPMSGYVYIDGLWIKKVLGGWWMLLDRGDYFNTDLRVLEDMLYEWAVDTGSTS